jgi:methionyl-tRNA formyltransferase
MTARVLLLGSTDFTLAIAEAINLAGAKVGAIVHVGDAFRISYAKDVVRNYRRADIQRWCTEHDAEAIPFVDRPTLSREIKDRQFAMCVLAGWYHMAEPSFRAKFERGCLAFHASLLPKLRGGAPLNWAILEGHAETGLSLFEVGDGVDDGPIYDQERFSIGPRSSIRDLIGNTAEAGAAIVRRSLPGILSGDIRARPQEGEPSYCLQRSPEDGRIDWRLPAVDIDRLVRAVSRPYPGGLTSLDGQVLAVHDTDVVANVSIVGAPGQVANLPGHPWPVVVCGNGCLAIHEAETDDGADAVPLLRKSSNKRLA